MGEFIKKNNKYYRNNSDGSQHEVTLGSDGHFHWVQPDGQHVRSVSKAETYFKPSIWDRILSGFVMGGNSDPGSSAIQTASGFSLDNNGSLKYNPESKGTKELQKALAATGATGAAVVSAAASPVVAGAINLYGAYEGAKRLTSEEGVKKTINKFKEGDIKGGFKSLGGDVVDLALTFPVLNRTRSFFNDATNGFLKGYYRSRYPIIYQELNAPEVVQKSIPYTASRLSIPFKQVEGFLPSPTSGRVYYGSVIPLANSEEIIALDSPSANLEFIQKFNKWNRRYGYPMIPKSLATDGNALNDAVKERLNQHNTFIRGVFIDNESNPEKYRELISKMQKQGIEPTKDNILEFLATHYLPETGRGGRAGFGNIPYVQQRGYDTNDVGTIYTSNSLEQAVGYANRNGTHTYRGVFKVRRPISFEGSREDWVRNADFPLHGYNSDKSNTYYQYELPYLMATGKAVPKQATIDWDKYNARLQLEAKPTLQETNAYNKILSIYKSQGRTPKLSNFGIGTPFLNYRINDLFNLLQSIHDKEAMPAYSADDFARLAHSTNDEFWIDPSISYNVKAREAYRLSSDYIPGVNRTKTLYSPKVLDKFEIIANSRNYRNSEYNRFKQQTDILRRKLKRKLLSYPTSKEIREFVTKAGVTPNKPIINIGTSEPLRTSTINADPSKAFQHVIFAGTPWEQGLELVERVPYSQWKAIYGSTSHRGKWTPGLSRKSKKNGGKLEYEPINEK